MKEPRIIKDTDDFINKSIKLNGDNIDYSKSIFVNAKTKVDMKCKKHDLEFSQLPFIHLNGRSGCNMCVSDKMRLSSNKLHSKEIFIEKSKFKNGEYTYDYSMVNYKNSYTKVILRCNKHDFAFEQRPYSNIRGEVGCKYCQSEIKSENAKSGNFVKNNPSKNATIDERRERSPFSRNFKKYVGLTDEEIDRRINDIKSIERISSNNIEWWINKGYTEEESKLLLKDRQTTFTLEKCIERHGEEEGTLIYNNRQERWMKSLNENGNMKGGFSKKSQDLFDEIKKFLNLNNCRYATNGGEFVLDRYSYDFMDYESNVIIEFNGDLYHGNPKIFKEEDCPNPFNESLKAKEIWIKDKKKIELAESNGYKLLTIWESDYDEDLKHTVDMCVNFIKNNKI